MYLGSFTQLLCVTIILCSTHSCIHSKQPAFNSEINGFFSDYILSKEDLEHATLRKKGTKAVTGAGPFQKYLCAFWYLNATY